MNAQAAFWLTLIGTVCWPLCFWWMHRISSRQDALLNELRQQGRRIEGLSEEEHKLIKEVHPTVGKIRDDIADVKSTVKKTGPRPK
jgi:hypothetical protein